MTTKPKAPKPKPIKFSKGIRTETVTLGEGKDAAKLTIRGLSYREVCYLSPMPDYESHRTQFRLGLTAVEGLKAPNKKTGKIETAELTWETIDVDGKETSILSLADFEEWFGNSIMVIKQVMDVINELSGLKVKDAQAVKIFRKNK